MAVFLSPVGGVAAQFFDNNGVILSGGKIYTYAAGTSTNATTYTSSSGGTAHANPIILDSAGRVPGGEIWLSDGVSYKFVIKTSTDVLVGTYDNITGINSNFVAYTSQQEIQTATAGQTVFTLTTMQYQPGTDNLSVFVDGVNQYGPGAQYAFVETDATTVTFTSGLHVGASVKFTTASPVASAVTNAENVAYDPPFVGAVATNVEAKLAQTVSVMDFGAVGDGVTDDTAAIQAAIDSFGSASSATKGCVYFPAGVYKITSSLVLTYGVSLQGASGRATKLNIDGDISGITWSGSIPSYSRNITISDFWLHGNGSTSANIAIQLNHPWGIDALSLKNLWIDGFYGYGIKTDQPGAASTTNCFQFSHWDTIYISGAQIGILMGAGFCGESVFSNITTQACTTYGVQFTIGVGTGSPGNQGQHWDTLIVGQCPTGIYFGAGNSGNLTFTNAHIEGCTNYGVRFNNGGAAGITFNQSRFVSNPVGVQCDQGGLITFNGGTWQTAGSSGNTYITVSAASNFLINLTGEQRKQGSTPTNELVSVDIGTFEGAVARKSTTTGTISGRYDTKLRFQGRGIMSELATVGPNNLAGRLAIGSGVQSVSVTFANAETDTDYVVLAQVSIVGAYGNTWQPAITVDTMTTSGFRVYFSTVSPSAGFILNWMILR